MKDNIFQLDGLVNAYRVALFTNIEELIFHVVKSIFIDADANK